MPKVHELDSKNCLRARINIIEYLKYLQHLVPPMLAFKLHPTREHNSWPNKEKIVLVLFYLFRTVE